MDFMPFSKALARSEIQTASSSILTWINDSVSSNDKPPSSSKFALRNDVIELLVFVIVFAEINIKHYFRSTLNRSLFKVSENTWSTLVIWEK